MAEVFVSYKSEDRRRVAPLVAALRSAGLDVWWDQDIVPPMNWRETISAQLESARVGLVVWTEGAVGAGGHYVREEAERLRASGAYLGVRLDPVLPPLGFGESQAADLSGWKGRRKSAQVEYLAELIRAKLLGETAAARPPPRPGRLPPIAWTAGLAAAVILAFAAWWFLNPGSRPAPSTEAFASESLARQPCAWVEIANILTGRNGDLILLTGAASSPAALRIALGRGATEAGIPLAGIDATHVVTAESALCDELEFLRSFKVAGRSRLSVDPPEMIEPRVARFRIQVDVRGLPPHRALFGLEAQHGLYSLARNQDEIRRLFGFREEAGREWLQGTVDHEGWSALVLVTANRPIDAGFIERVSRESDVAFVEEFTRRARDGGWSFHLGAIDCDLSRPIGEPC